MGKGCEIGGSRIILYRDDSKGLKNPKFMRPELPLKGRTAKMAYKAGIQVVGARLNANGYHYGHWVFR